MVDWSEIFFFKIDALVLSLLHYIEHPLVGVKLIYSPSILLDSVSFHMHMFLFSVDSHVHHHSIFTTSDSDLKIDSSYVFKYQRKAETVYAVYSWQILVTNLGACNSLVQQL